jgi:hypothetical protein
MAGMVMKMSAIVSATAVRNRPSMVSRLSRPPERFDAASTRKPPASSTHRITSSTSCLPSSPRAEFNARLIAPPIKLLAVSC